MTTELNERSTVALSTLPALGEPLEDGLFAGIITRTDGTHAAVVLLPAVAQALTWKKAKDWAAEQGGELPTRPVAALLYANVKKHLVPRWHWTSEAESASCAWGCTFYYGGQYGLHKSYEGCAVPVRLIPLTA